MKKLLTIILLISAIGIKSQTITPKQDSLLHYYQQGISSITNTVKSSIPDSAQLTVKQVYADFKSGMMGIASALKVGVEQVFGILVRQQMVYSVINLILYVFLVIFTFVLYNKSKSSYKAHLELNKNVSKSYYTIDDSAKGVASVILGIMSGILFISLVSAFIMTLSETITGFINPEYGAIKEIMDVVKGGTK